MSSIKLVSRNKPSGIKIIPIILFCLLVLAPEIILSAGAAELNSKPISENKLSTLLSNKTLILKSTFDIKNHQRAVAVGVYLYFNEDGSLNQNTVERVMNQGSPRSGKWRTKDGQICITLRRGERCNAVNIVENKYVIYYSGFHKVAGELIPGIVMNFNAKLATEKSQLAITAFNRLANEQKLTGSSKTKTTQIERIRKEKLENVKLANEKARIEREKDKIKKERITLERKKIVAKRAEVEKQKLIVAQKAKAQKKAKIKKNKQKLERIAKAKRLKKEAANRAIVDEKRALTEEVKRLKQLAEGRALLEQKRVLAKEVKRLKQQAVAAALIDQKRNLAEKVKLLKQQEYDRKAQVEKRLLIEQVEILKKRAAKQKEAEELVSLNKQVALLKQKEKERQEAEEKIRIIEEAKLKKEEGKKRILAAKAELLRQEAEEKIRIIEKAKLKKEEEKKRILAAKAELLRQEAEKKMAEKRRLLVKQLENLKKKEKEDAANKKSLEKKLALLQTNSGSNKASLGSQPKSALKASSEKSVVASNFLIGMCTSTNKENIGACLGKRSSGYSTWTTFSYKKKELLLMHLAGKKNRNLKDSGRNIPVSYKVISANKVHVNTISPSCSYMTLFELKKSRLYKSVISYSRGCQGGQKKALDLSKKPEEVFFWKPGQKVASTIKRKKQKVVAPRKQKIEYPYEAILSCGMGNNHINIMACFVGRSPTSLELKNGNFYRLYRHYEVRQAGRETNRGLVIPLREHFNIKVQNSSANLTLRLKVFRKSSGKRLFIESGGQYKRLGVKH